jgi:hypothetical protein
LCLQDQTQCLNSGPLDQGGPQQITDQTQYLHDRLLVLVDVVQELAIKIEVRCDEITRRERHPLRERNVLEMRRAEQFEEPERITASVLDVMPWAMPHVFSGLKVAITLAVIGAIVAEFIGADTGLGYLILTNSGALKTSVVFFVLLILSLLGIALFYSVEAIERTVCPWYISDTTKAKEL